MGFLSRLLSGISGKEKSKPVEAAVQKEIKLSELKEWIKNESDKKKHGAKDIIEELRQQFMSEKQAAKEKISALRTAKLKNPNIPERAKQIMEGNRRNYLMRAELLLKGLEPPKDIGSTAEFCALFEKNLDIFGRASLRSFHVLQEFFGDETSAVANSIKKLHSIAAKAKAEAKKTGADKTAELISMADELNSRQAVKKQLETGLANAKKETKKKNENLKQEKERLKQFISGKEYADYTSLLEKQQEIEKKMHALELRLFHSFSAIGAALKKYERMSIDDKIVKAYMDDPLKALADDHEMKIIRIMEKMRSSVASGEIEMKDAKKESVLKGIDAITPEFLKEVSEEYSLLLSEKESAEKSIRENSSAGEKERIEAGIKAMEETAASSKAEMQRMENEIRIAEEKTASIKEEIEQQIRSSLGEDVAVVVVVVAGTSGKSS